MSALCRYYQTECNGPGSTKQSLCDKECPGPKEVKKMPRGTPAPVGSCPTCGEEGKLKSGGLSETPICHRCYKRLANQAYNVKAGRSKPGNGHGKAAKAKPASHEVQDKAPAKIAQSRPAQSVHATVKTLTAALQSECVVLRVTCHEIDQVRRVLAATSGMTVHVGLEG